MKAPVAVVTTILILVVAFAARGSRAQPLSDVSSDAYQVCVGKGQTVLDKCLSMRGVFIAQTEFEVATNAAADAVGNNAGHDNLIEGHGPSLDDLLDLIRLDVPGPTLRVELMSLGVGVRWESVLALRDTLFDVPEKVSTQESDIEAAWTGRDDTTIVSIMEIRGIGEWFGWGSRLRRSEVIFDR